MDDLIKQYCETRADVVKLLISNESKQFYVDGQPDLLHSFEINLEKPFITMDRETETESFSFKIKNGELNKLWIEDRK